MTSANVLILIHIAAIAVLTLYEILILFEPVDEMYSNKDTSAQDKRRIALLIIWLGLMILFFYGEYRKDGAEWTISDKPYAVEHIVALGDSNMINGTVYMRRGYIDEDLWYQYMVKVDGGGFVANKVRSDSAVLYYSDGDYRVEWYEKHRGWLWFTSDANYYKIYIPEGTIVDDFTVDLK